ncbi:MAG: hypothetical protein NT118_13515, partial [Lentisphaerae bacterium]|nr:hypothetical protein [Lentisphaerota bacterium]
MKNTSLKTRMTLVVSLLVTVLLSVMAMVSLSYFESQYKEIISRDHYSLVSAMADTIDDKIRGASNLLNSLAVTGTPDIIADPAKLRKLFAGHPVAGLVFDNGLFMLSANGKMLGGTKVEPNELGKDYSLSDYFKNTVATRKPCISEPFSPTLKQRHPIVVFTVPLFDSKDNLTAILCGSADLMSDYFLGRLADVRLEDYDAVYYPGGHGPMEDLWQDADSGRLLIAALASGKPLAIVCHA